MGENNQRLWRGVRNATGDGGIEVVQTTAADLNVTAALSAGTETDLDNIAARVLALIDDTIKGALRSIGDAGAGPSNTTGFTVLQRLSNLATLVTQTDALEDDTMKGLLRSIGDAGASPTNATGETLLALMDAIRDNTRRLSGDTGTQQLKYNTRSGTGNTTMHTVTAGKTLFISTVFVNTWPGVAQHRATIEIFTGAGASESTIIAVVSNAAADSASLALAFPMPIKVAAAKTVRLVTTASMFADAGFTGWEE